MSTPPASDTSDTNRMYGKHDADHLRGQLDLAGRLRKARGEEVYEPRRGQHAEHGHAEQHQREERPDAADEIARRVRAALAVVLGEDRHERLRERAFGEHAAQDVRQPERRLEGVHLDAGAEEGCLQALAHEPGDAGQERHPADGGQGAEEVHVG